MNLIHHKYRIFLLYDFGPKGLYNSNLSSVREGTQKYVLATSNFTLKQFIKTEKKCKIFYLNFFQVALINMAVFIC